MKKLSMLLALVMLFSCAAFTASAEGEYTQAPWFDAAVEAGELPPVEERLPENPCLIKEVLDEYLDQEVGNYGGTLRFATNGVNWDADIFVAMDEAFLTMESTSSDVITANVVESYSVNEDLTEYTFTLRKGLKWSDGTPLTMADVEFGINDYVFNTELTPVISSYMRDGGVAAGDPFTFTVIDDWTFTLTFKSPYGGFPVHLSIAGWKGYTDLIKPAHYLKQFHINYAEECHGSLDAYYEFMQPFATFMGYDDITAEGVWCYVFNQVDCTNWECTDPNDALTDYYFGDITELHSFPQLYPWILTDVSGNNFMTFERNPYYFKVDADGQQLPYFDKLTSQYIEDVEMMQFSAASGELDFMRESATINNISMYREYSQDAGITAYTTDMHTTASILSVNFNYGLNTDGTVKDDDESKAWQEVINDKRFLQALTISINAEEIVDAVYNGFAEPCEQYNCSYDIEGAKDLLAEMGCVDLDGDGFVETPSGLPLVVDLYITTGGSNTDTLASCQLFVEYWMEAGLNAKVNPTDSTLLETNQEANELKIQAGWIHGSQLWHYQEWYLNMPLWEDWVNAGGLTGTMKSDTDVLLEPSQEWKDFINSINGCFTVDPVTAVNENVPAVLQMSADNLWVIQPVQKIQQCVVINDDVRNVPTGGIGISWDFAIPQMYYENPEEHLH